MTEIGPAAIGRLSAVLRPMGATAVAVSGGVDSLTLAAAAHHLRLPAVEVFHAVSPAVPPEATERVRAFAAAGGWRLTVLDAGEFASDTYRSNPLDRCFHCKSHLYAAVAGRTAAQVVSGTNLDDLGDWRPGLRAAADHKVRHPFVEAAIDKATVRAIGRAIGLGAVAELPASPCLSSRIETGIRIEADLLALVHAVEREVTRRLAPRTVRCRVRPGRLVVELDAATLAALTEADRRALQESVAELPHALPGPMAFAAYRTGSAFVGHRHD